MASIPYFDVLTQAVISLINGLNIYKACTALRKFSAECLLWKIINYITY